MSRREVEARAGLRGLAGELRPTTVRLASSLEFLQEEDGGSFAKALRALQTALPDHPSWSEAASQAAQTIVCGMVAARWIQLSGLREHSKVPSSCEDLDRSSARLALAYCHASLPTLLFDEVFSGQLPGEGEGLVDELLSIVNSSDSFEMVYGPGLNSPIKSAYCGGAWIKENPEPVKLEPLLSFPEHLLESLDNRQRKHSGVYFTPYALSRSMVEQVDLDLREKLGFSQGLADVASWGEIAAKQASRVPECVSLDEPAIQILDPSAGSGVFLLAVIDCIRTTLHLRWGDEGLDWEQRRELWGQYVRECLLPRLHGLELQLAPYCMCHVAVAFYLASSGVRLAPEESPSIHLVDTVDWWLRRRSGVDLRQPCSCPPAPENQVLPQSPRRVRGSRRRGAPCGCPGYGKSGTWATATGMPAQGAPAPATGMPAGGAPAPATGMPAGGAPATATGMPAQGAPAPENRIFPQSPRRGPPSASGLPQLPPMTVILGNPPYSVRRSSKRSAADRLVSDYQTGLGVEKERKKGVLQDLYIQFLRISQEMLEPSPIGLLCYVTNRSYLDGTVHRAMRRSLLESFNAILIHDMDPPTSAERGRTKRPFAIRQGTCVSLFLKWSDEERPGQVSYHELYLDSSQTAPSKSATLLSKRWRREKRFGPMEPQYLFRPTNERVRARYDDFIGIDQIFPVGSSGIETEKDHFVVGFDREELLERIRRWATSEREKGGIDQEMGGAADELELHATANWDPEQARAVLREDTQPSRWIRRYLYRAFDERFLFYHPALVIRPRTRVMRHMVDGNLALVGMRQTRGEAFGHVFVTRLISNKFVLSSKSSNVSYHWPLYLKAERDEGEGSRLEGRPRRRANIASSFVEAVRIRTGLEWRGTRNVENALRSFEGIDCGANESPTPSGKGTRRVCFGAEDVLHYVYALLSSPLYCSAYSEQLALDFARVPHPTSAETFMELAEMGAELVAVHLLENDHSGAPRIHLRGPRGRKRNITARPMGIEQLRRELELLPDGSTRLYVNKNAYLEGIPHEVWPMKIGGYQICFKWLDDRKKAGSLLGAEELEQYARVVHALSRTLEIRKRIDAIVERLDVLP